MSNNDLIRDPEVEGVLEISTEVDQLYLEFRGRLEGSGSARRPS